MAGHTSTRVSPEGRESVAEMAEAEWQSKFKRALAVTQRDTKRYFDSL